MSRCVLLMSSTASSKVKIGLVQMAMVADPRKNVAKAQTLIADAAKQGAQVICLPEMFNTLYFCRTQDTAQFDLAEPIPGPTVEAMQKTPASPARAASMAALSASRLVWSAMSVITFITWPMPSAR
ncbi:MAG: nitrilase-related carbon-nitrogen hydrolase [Puniceicoccales bacterium]